MPKICPVSTSIRCTLQNCSRPLLFAVSAAHLSMPVFVWKPRSYYNVLTGRYDGWPQRLLPLYFFLWSCTQTFASHDGCCCAFFFLFWFQRLGCKKRYRRIVFAPVRHCVFVCHALFLINFFPTSQNLCFFSILCPGTYITKPPGISVFNMWRFFFFNCGIHGNTYTPQKSGPHSWDNTEKASKLCLKDLI